MVMLSATKHYIMYDYCFLNYENDNSIEVVYNSSNEDLDFLSSYK